MAHLLAKLCDQTVMMKAWLKMQGYLFMPVSCGLVASGWQFYLHPRHILRIKAKGEALALVTRYVLFFGLLCNGYSWAGTWATYNLYNWVASSYIFTNFSLSHNESINCPGPQPASTYIWPLGVCRPSVS